MGFAPLILRNFGGATVAPLALVVVSGFFVYFDYNLKRAVDDAGISGGGALFQFARGVHLWSSRAFLVAVLVHLAWVWWAGTPRATQRNTYLLGAGALASAVLAHYSGHLLRWDRGARELTAYDLGPFIFPPAANNYPGFTLFVHAALATGLLALFVILHLGTIWGGARLHLQQPLPPRSRAAATTGAVAITTIVLGCALILGAPDRSNWIPWPFGVFAKVAEGLGVWYLFPVTLGVLWTIIAIQPWIDGFHRTAWPTRALVALAVLATALPVRATHA